MQRFWETADFNVTTLGAIAKEILDFVTNRQKMYGSVKVSEGTFESLLYKGLTRTGNDQECLFLCRRQFDQALRSLKFPPNADASMSSAWFHVLPKIQKPAKPKLGNKYDVDHKLFFRFYGDFWDKAKSGNKWDCYMAFEEIVEMLQTLPQLFTALFPLNADNDYIQFKIGNNIEQFLSHADTLVVHFQNAQHEANINQIVNQTFAANQVKFGSYALRPTRGYDIGHQGGGGMSYTEMLARLISRDLAEVVNSGQLQRMNQGALTQWLSQGVQKYGSMNGEGLAKARYGPRFSA